MQSSAPGQPGAPGPAALCCVCPWDGVMPAGGRLWEGSLRTSSLVRRLVLGVGVRYLTEQWNPPRSTGGPALPALPGTVLVSPWSPVPVCLGLSNPPQDLPAPLGGEETRARRGPERSLGRGLQLQSAAKARVSGLRPPASSGLRAHRGHRRCPPSARTARCSVGPHGSAHPPGPFLRVPCAPGEMLGAPPLPVASMRPVSLSVLILKAETEPS